MSTLTTRPVVVAVDGSERSAGAIRYAIAAAQEERTWLSLVHVVPTYPPFGPATPLPLTELQDTGRQILREAMSDISGLAPDLETRAHLLVGTRSSGICREASDARLLVLGRETRHGIDRVLTGTTTAAVAAHATCPVAVVPSFWTPGETKGAVVVGVKTRAHGSELLARAFEIAAARGARVVLVTAWELPDPYLDRIEVRTHAATWEADGRRELESMVADWRTAYPDVPVDLRVRHGRPASVLLAESAGADLLVLARPRHKVPPFHRLGSVGHALLHAIDIPVEVVPIEGGHAADQVQAGAVEVPAAETAGRP